MLNQDNPGSKIQRQPVCEPKEIVTDYIEERLSISSPQFMLGFKDNDVGYDGRRLLKKYMLTDILISMIAGESSPL